MDFDRSLDDMILSAYRLSWPDQSAKPKFKRNLLRRVMDRCRNQGLEGWPVALSAPASQ